MKEIVDKIKFLKEKRCLSMEEIIDEMANQKVYDVILRNALLAVFGGKMIDEIYDKVYSHKFYIKNRVDNPFNQMFFDTLNEADQKDSEN